MPHVWKRLGIEFPEFACGVLGEPYVPSGGARKQKGSALASDRYGRLPANVELESLIPCPSGSGNLDVQLGRQRLPLADPLHPFKPVQGPIDLTAQVCFVAQQAIRRIQTWNDRGGLMIKHLPRSIFSRCFSSSIKCLIRESISTIMCSLANSLCRGQEKPMMRESELQIGNSG